MKLNLVSMKSSKGFMLFLWFIFTLILIFSVVGMFLFIQAESGRRSTWMQIGLDLKDAYIKSQS